mmetsp:Transcript_1028/g.3611  ORF Transcript_1028/g.3611 Transcript_1028/m.3611 type:complete len:331 (+) Transcript_1028:296-1288(+)
MLVAMIARHKRSMNEHLSTGLASGLCGSLTTFATWMGETASMCVNGHPFQAVVSVVSMLCVSLCCYRLGHYVAGCGMGDEPRCFDDLCGLRALLARGPAPAGPGPGEAVGGRGGGAKRSEAASSQVATSSEEAASKVSEGDLGSSAEVVEGEGELDWGLAIDSSESWHEPESPKDVKLSPVLEWCIVVLALALIASYIGVCVAREYSAGLLDLPFAPVGALLRWYLSLYNASAQKACFGIPLFTLLANTLGCACNAASAVLVHHAGSDIAAITIAAVSTGFAGCLSTVSTLISELRSDSIGGLRVRALYFLLSIGLAMAVFAPVLAVAPC